MKYFIALFLAVALPAAAQSLTCPAGSPVTLTCAGGTPPPPPPPGPTPTPTPTPTPPPPSGCGPAAVELAVTYTGAWQNFSISSGQTASLRLPVVTTSGGGWAEIIAFQSTSTPSDLQTTVAIADCKGKFDVDPRCTQTGSAWSSIDLHADAKDFTYCPLRVGVQYYVNVRNDCQQNACEQRIQYFGNLR